MIQRIILALLVLLGALFVLILINIIAPLAIKGFIFIIKLVKLGVQAICLKIIILEDVKVIFLQVISKFAIKLV